MNRKEFYNDIESWIGALDYAIENTGAKLNNKFGNWWTVYWTEKQKQHWNSFLDNYFDLIHPNQYARKWKKDIWANRYKENTQYPIYSYDSAMELNWEENPWGDYRLDFMPDGWFVAKDVGDEPDIYLMYKEGEFVYYFNPGGMYKSLWLNGPVEFIGDTAFNALHLGDNLIEKPRWMFLNWKEGIEEAK
tara:strand:+ start:58 stop:627 length:570 start_codon:yes stop_codon:yes gene_type:complete